MTSLSNSVILNEVKDLKGTYAKIPALRVTIAQKVRQTVTLRVKNAKLYRQVMPIRIHRRN